MRLLGLLFACAQATAISPQGYGYRHSPGVYTLAQVRLSLQAAHLLPLQAPPCVCTCVCVRVCVCDWLGLLPLHP